MPCIVSPATSRAWTRPARPIPFFINVLGEFEGKQGAGASQGRHGTVTQAMAAAVREHGVEIRTSAPVARIIMRDGRAEGVRLSRETNSAPRRARQHRPEAYLLTFVGRSHLDPAFADGIAHLRMGHASLRLTWR